MDVRLCKIVLTGASAFFLLLVVFNNLVDYGSNLAFVRHVLGMDTVFEANRGSWRAIENTAAHHLFFWMIIGWESAAMVLIAVGTWRLWQARRFPTQSFQRAKTLATVGLTVGLLLWYAAFISIGGEWFLMWQSRWNGQDAALRMFAVMGISLIFLQMREADGEGEGN